MCNSLGRKGRKRRRIPLERRDAIYVLKGREERQVKYREELARLLRMEEKGRVHRGRGQPG